MPITISPVCWYPVSKEFWAPPNPIQSFTGGQVATLNGLFHGQTGHLPNMANTKASERQIFNWSTSALQRQYHPFFLNMFFYFYSNIYLFFFVCFPCHFWAVMAEVSASQVYFFKIFTFSSMCKSACVDADLQSLVIQCQYCKCPIIF